MSNHGNEHHKPFDANDPIPALTALYLGERSDISIILNTAMAMMGVAVAYLVGAMLFIEKISAGPSPGLFLIILPAPLWLILAFHSLTTLTAMSHTTSVILIEDELFNASNLSKKTTRDMVGAVAGEKILAIDKSRPIHKLVTAFVYVGFNALIILFTIYMLCLASKLVHMQYIWMASFAYSLLVIMVGLSWRVGLRMISTSRRGL